MLVHALISPFQPLTSLRILDDGPHADTGPSNGVRSSSSWSGKGVDLPPMVIHYRCIVRTPNIRELMLPIREGQVKMKRISLCRSRFVTIVAFQKMLTSSVQRSRWRGGRDAIRPRRFHECRARDSHGHPTDREELPRAEYWL
jgi:hypothetical protein